MTVWTEQTVADELYRAELERRDRPPFTDEWESFGIDAAYRIQDRLIRRKTDAGERLVGLKLGLTSEAKQRRMGISTPLTAWVTDRMVLPAEAPVPLHELIHPRIEPEIVFTMRDRLAGPGVTAESALAAVGSVHAGFEIIDSRYRDFRFRLSDVIADNASSSRLYVSELGHDPADVDLPAERCSLVVDGREVDAATGAAVQGNPAQALALAANALAERGLAVEPGWIVLTGGLTDAVFVQPGSSYTVDFENLGSLTVRA